ncbi:hypothetical protein FB2170_08909 [Maribacter sp. HTCC2170]|nr:hypothetical protein FB2170_08909 [Maribacter sp. HTCC2170]
MIFGFDSTSKITVETPQKIPLLPNDTKNNVK